MTQLRAGFYDRQGNPISVEQWGEMFEDYRGRTVAVTDIGDALSVRTMWLGHVEPGDPCARMFGTVLLRDGHFLAELEVYDTEQQAAAGHGVHVARVRGQATS